MICDINYTKIDLSGADPAGFLLSNTDLSHANLIEAKLDLSKGSGWAILTGATMPDGTKHK
ncbi:MAG: hypothetical protein H6Q68_290 [Firmicutes bacterium]|nr:hypothetical protein [Bacillota bacterium]